MQMQLGVDIEGPQVRHGFFFLRPGCVDHPSQRAAVTILLFFLTSCWIPSRAQAVRKPCLCAEQATRKRIDFSMVSPRTC